VLSVVKDLFLPWYNALRFFTQNANRGPADGAPEAGAGGSGVISTFVADPAIAAASTNAMDRWIYAAVQVRVQGPWRVMR
jgi:isoleucyl-tRNA synthetase